MSVYYRLGANLRAQVPDALPLVPGTNSACRRPEFVAGGVSADKMLFRGTQGRPDKLLKFIDNLNIKNSRSGVEKASLREAGRGVRLSRRPTVFSPPRPGAMRRG